jgi:hypothetical protein
LTRVCSSPCAIWLNNPAAVPSGSYWNINLSYHTESHSSFKIFSPWRVFEVTSLLAALLMYPKRWAIEPKCRWSSVCSPWSPCRMLGVLWWQDDGSKIDNYT